MKETQITPTSRKAAQYRGVECLNCGHPLDLSDRYCAYCGQLNTTKRLSLGDFFNEFILSVFTYDSRFRYTIKDLLFKPGTITRNYVDGKRLKYANPFRFFLSASIFYFVILAVVGLFKEEESFSFQDGGIVNVQTDDGEQQVDLNEIADDIDLSGIKNYNQQELSQLEEKIDARIKEGASKITSQNEEKSYDRTPEDSLPKTFMGSIAKRGKIFYEFYEATEIGDAATALDSLGYTPSKTNLLLYSKNKDIERVKNNPTRFIQYLISKTPFFLFFFAPIIALFFWLIYSKKKFNYMEHLVFIFHIFSWIFVVLIICLLPDLLLPSDNALAAIILLIIGPFYFYKALRNFYKEKRRYTLLKFVFLNFVVYIGSILFAIVFFAITAFLF